MKNKLQYLYSILVLSGVLVSSYLMVEQRPRNSGVARVQSAEAYRAEPRLSAPGLDQILVFESQFKAIEALGNAPTERQLTESKKKKHKDHQEIPGSSKNSD